MKIGSLIFAALAMLALSVNHSQAVAPFGEAFKNKYAQPGSPLAPKYDGAKCHTCHVGKDRKNRNEYGEAVGQFLKKADFVGKDKKFDPKSPEGQKALFEGLEKAGEEKSPSGKTFAELIESGELPAPVKK